LRQFLFGVIGGGVALAIDLSLGVNGGFSDLSVLSQ
jgi:hypothetical protein